MGGRESQHLIVPLKRGNQPEGPRRGKEVPSHEPLKGNMPGTLRPEPCPRTDDGSRGSRIHEMRNRVRVMCKPVLAQLTHTAPRFNLRDPLSVVVSWTRPRVPM